MSPASPALAGKFFTTESLGKAQHQGNEVNLGKGRDQEEKGKEKDPSIRNKNGNRLEVEQEDLLGTSPC